MWLQAAEDAVQCMRARMVLRDRALGCSMWAVARVLCTIAHGVEAGWGSCGSVATAIQSTVWMLKTRRSLSLIIVQAAEQSPMHNEGNEQHACRMHEYGWPAMLLRLASRSLAR